MATIDDELGQLERDIRQLKVEYDQFFGGGRKRPPSEIEWRIELLMKRYGERTGELKLSQRFRMNNLAQTYAKYKDVFRKRLQQREEGKVQRHFGAAAKIIEAQRAKKLQEEAASAGGAGVRAAAAGEGQPFRVTCSDPAQEADKVDLLYQAVLEAKKRAGEPVEKLSRATFDVFVRKKTKDLQKQKRCKDVEYVVETVDGQVKLKALVKV